MSLYADDATVFISPTPAQLQVTQCILHLFGQATGLITNLDKTEYFPICCDNTNLQHLPIQTSSFPCKYLGLPLHYKKLSRANTQPLIQKIGDRIPGWKKKFLSCPGRELLLKTVLITMPTYFLSMFKLHKWAIKSIDRLRRSFFWRGSYPEHCHGGHCLVNWETCLLPKKYGGLGFKDLEKFGRALCL